MRSLAGSWIFISKSVVQSEHPSGGSALSICWVVCVRGWLLVLGGFTTFSTAVLDAVTLIRERKYRTAVGLALGVWLGASVLAVTGFLIAVSFAM